MHLLNFTTVKRVYRCHTVTMVKTLLVFFHFDKNNRNISIGCRIINRVNTVIVNYRVTVSFFTHKKIIFKKYYRNEVRQHAVPLLFILQFFYLIIGMILINC